MIGSIPEAELPSRKAAYTGSSATASLRYLGAFATPRGPSHFWSFPTACGLAWAELTEGGTLTMPHELPQAVRDATPARAEHHTKTPPRARQQPRRP